MKVYLSGPINGLTFDGADGWRQSVAEMLRDHGIQAINPLRFKERLREAGVLPGLGFDDAFGPFSSARAVMTRDRYDSTRCDVLLVNLLGAERISIGTMFEMAWADAHRVPIVLAMEKYGNPHEHIMVQEAAGFRVPSLIEAVEVVVGVLK